MLSNADASKEQRFLEIVEDTSAIVFLGTPHRCSGATQLGDIARKIVIAVRVDTSSAILDALGLRNDDLARSQLSFARIWEERRFEVKTFQESRALTGVNIGILNELVSPVMAMCVVSYVPVAAYCALDRSSRIFHARLSQGASRGS